MRQMGRSAEALREVEIFDVELAKQTPLAVSDEKLEAARNDIELQRALHAPHSVAVMAQEPALGGFTR